jgi:hypothetical protein
VLRHTSSATQRGQFHGEETGSMCTVQLTWSADPTWRIFYVIVSVLFVPGGNPGLKCTRIGAIFKKSVVKTTFKLKINI